MNYKLYKADNLSKGLNQNQKLASCNFHQPILKIFTENRQKAYQIWERWSWLIKDTKCYLKMTTLTYVLIRNCFYSEKISITITLHISIIKNLWFIILSKKQLRAKITNLVTVERCRVKVDNKALFFQNFVLLLIFNIAYLKSKQSKTCFYKNVLYLCF